MRQPNKKNNKKIDVSGKPDGSVDKFRKLFEKRDVKKTNTKEERQKEDFSDAEISFEDNLEYSDNLESENSDGFDFSDEKPEQEDEYFNSGYQYEKDVEEHQKEVSEESKNSQRRTSQKEKSNNISELNAEEAEKILRKKLPKHNGNKKMQTGEIPLSKQDPEHVKKRKPLPLRILSKIGSFLLVWGLAFGIVGILLLGAGATIVYSFSDSELDQKFASVDLDYTSYIYANSLSSQEPVEYDKLYSTENRSWVSIEEMPQYLLDAVICTEDKRFYSHHGVDPIRTVYSTLLYAGAKVTGKSTSNLPGGSTLTQQLIKTITETGQDRSPTRKLKEILQALYIERKYTKEQILEYYLNAVHFGNNCDGIEAAANYYYDKKVKDLTPVECASIICITKSPVNREPYKNPENNKERRNDILYYMHEQKKLNDEDYEYWIKQDITLRDQVNNPVKVNNSNKVLSWFSDIVFEEVRDKLETDYNYTRQQAINYIYTGGLRIYTTMVTEYQDILDKYFTDENNYKDSKKSYDAQVAMELMDPKTGNVLAVIGGRGEKTASLTLNRVTGAFRQPGSAIKPLTVYGYAIENNLITEGSAVDDAPLVNVLYGEGSKLTDPLTGKTISDAYDPWPKNYDSRYNGLLDVKTALSYSYNTPSAKVLNMIGKENSYQFAKNMLGLKNLTDEDAKYDAPLSVGALSKGVTVEEMTAAYTAFANDGTYCAPRYISRVETYDGKILYENEIDKQIVFTPQTAYIITDILSNLQGSSKAGSLGNKITVAAKSGTTSNYNDRWYIGYTPNFLAGIWWGYDENGDNQNTHQIVMWQAVMKQIHEAAGITESKFTKPDGLVEAAYCMISGQLEGPYCKMDPYTGGKTVKKGIFKSGTEPTQVCTVHHQLYVCNSTGQIACESCPSVSLQVFRDCSRSFKNAYVEVKDSEYVCPPLTSETILYKDSLLPAYSYMLPEGQYPSLPESKHASPPYANCVCAQHATGSIVHYYGYKGSSSSDQAPGGEAMPEILSPSQVKELYGVKKNN